jgi:hypothetical protein
MERFAELGAVRAFCKLLAENDNSKQQVYLGASLDVVQMFPIAEVTATSKGRDSNYKAKLEFLWVGKDYVERATGAQLILYPQYPEVRLSGFLRGCKLAPNEILRPIPRDQRRFNNGPDGRILFFGITDEGETLAYVADAGSALAQEFRYNNAQGRYARESVFFDLPLQEHHSRAILIAKLTDIRKGGWHPSIRLNKRGEALPYKARNGGGYTLEALLGIIPNGRSEPDFMGWEIKAHSGSRVTLMTPEPDGGLYGTEGVKHFVRRFGSQTGNDTLYFTGTHRAHLRNAKTGLTLSIRGFNPECRRIEDVNGAVELLTDAGDCAAAWSFKGLMIGWNKKHSQAAYVRYESRQTTDPAYRYCSPALLGEGTDVTYYLSAIWAGQVIFDPGSKIMNASTANSTVKARSQFRMPATGLTALYRQFGPVDI